MKSENLGNILIFEKKSKRRASEGMNNGDFKFFTSSPIQTKKVSNSDYEGEFLIFGTGGSASIHYCSGKFSTSADCLVASTNGVVLTKYVYYYLKYNLDLIENSFQGSGLRHTSKSRLKDIVILYPDNIQNQKKIISIFEKVDIIIEKRNRSNQLRDIMIRSYFYEMFRNPLIQDRWDLKPLSEFGKIVTGNTPPRRNKEYYGSYIDWIKSDNLNHSGIFLTRSSEMLSEIGATVGRIVPKGSVLITCIAGSIDCIGNAAIADREVSFNQQINAIVPKSNIDSFYLYYLIEFSKSIIQSVSSKSLKGIVNKSKLSSIKFSIPPINLQKKFSIFVQKVQGIREFQDNSMNKTRSLSNSLAQKLLAREIIN